MGNMRFIILLFMLVFFSCKQEDEKTKLAQVHDKILYLEDLYDIIPDDASNQDSIIMVNNKKVMKGYKTSIWVNLGLFAALFFSCVISYKHQQRPVRKTYIFL